MSTLQEIAGAALKLSPAEREQLITTWDAHFVSDPENERAWVTEALRRSAEIESGAVEGISWEESTERLRQKYHRLR